MRFDKTEETMQAASPWVTPHISVNGGSSQLKTSRIPSLGIYIRLSAARCITGLVRILLPPVDALSSHIQTVSRRSFRSARACLSFSFFGTSLAAR